MILDPLKALHFIAQVLFDKKAFNILALDVREISTLTDYLIIAEGNVDRHVLSLGQAVVEALKSQGEKCLRVEGLQLGDWVVLDYGDVMVHLFMPGIREKYRLESVWREGKIIDLKIEADLVSSKD